MSREKAPATVAGIPKYRAGRELAALKGGPWNACWYWRDELEAQQVTAREKIAAGLPASCGAKAQYVPTEEWTTNPDPDAKLNGVEGRVWKWSPS